MTVDPLDPTSPDAGATPQAAAALAAAEACAAVLPASEVLSPGDPQPGNEHVVSVFAAAATAELSGGVQGRVTVLVGEELVAAIASSPPFKAEMSAVAGSAGAGTTIAAVGCASTPAAIAAPDKAAISRIGNTRRCDRSAVMAWLVPSLACYVPPASTGERRRMKRA